MKSYFSLEILLFPQNRLHLKVKRICFQAFYFPLLSPFCVYKFVTHFQEILSVLHPTFPSSFLFILPLIFYLYPFMFCVTINMYKHGPYSLSYNILMMHCSPKLDLQLCFLLTIDNEKKSTFVLFY